MSVRCWTLEGGVEIWRWFLWCCGGMCGMICISYKIYPFIWFLFASMSEAFFQKIFIKTVYRVSEVFG